MPLARSRLLRTCRYALKFDGVDDYVSIADSASLKPDCITIMAWVKKPTTSRGAIIGKTLDSDPYGTQTFALMWGGSYWGGYLWDSAGTMHLVAGGTLEVNEWINLALTYDGSVQRLYKNAVEIASSSWSGVLRKTVSPVRLGRWWRSDPAWWDGFIAQILIYSRSLSQDEIQWNINNPDNPVWNGLVLWLPGLDEYIQPPTWYDRSIFKNNGTIYGATKTEIILKAVRSQAPLRIQSPVR